MSLSVCVCGTHGAMCAHTFIRGEILSAISVTQYGALTVDSLFFHWKQLWSPRKAKNPSNRLVRPRGGGAAPAGDAFARSGIGGSPKTTATDEGPEATTCSVRASVATVGTSLPLAGPMCSAIFVANELPDVGVRVSCRICGAGRSASGIWAASCTCNSLRLLLQPRRATKIAIRQDLRSLNTARRAGTSSGRHTGAQEQRELHQACT